MSQNRQLSFNLLFLVWFFYRFKNHIFLTSLKNSNIDSYNQKYNYKVPKYFKCINKSTRIRHFKIFEEIGILEKKKDEKRNYYEFKNKFKHFDEYLEFIISAFSKKSSKHYIKFVNLLKILQHIRNKSNKKKNSIIITKSEIAEIVGFDRCEEYLNNFQEIMVLAICKDNTQITFKPLEKTNLNFQTSQVIKLDEFQKQENALDLSIQYTSMTNSIKTEQMYLIDFEKSKFLKI